MPEHKIEIPQSDFDRYEEKQKEKDESLKTGEGIYIKGDKLNGQIKKKQR